MKSVNPNELLAQEFRTLKPNEFIVDRVYRLTETRFIHDNILNERKEVPYEVDARCEGVKHYYFYTKGKSGYGDFKEENYTIYFDIDEYLFYIYYDLNYPRDRVFVEHERIGSIGIDRIVEVEDATITL